MSYSYSSYSDSEGSFSKSDPMPDVSTKKPSASYSYSDDSIEITAPNPPKCSSSSSSSSSIGSEPPIKLAKAPSPTPSRSPSKSPSSSCSSSCSSSAEVFESDSPPPPPPPIKAKAKAPPPVKATPPPSTSSLNRDAPFNSVKVGGPSVSSHFDGITGSDFQTPKPPAPKAKAKPPSKVNEPSKITHTKDGHAIYSADTTPRVVESHSVDVMKYFCPIMGGFCTDGCQHGETFDEFRKKKANKKHIPPEIVGKKVYYTNPPIKPTKPIKVKQRPNLNTRLNQYLYASDNPLEYSTYPTGVVPTHGTLDTSHISVFGLNGSQLPSYPSMAPSLAMHQTELAQSVPAHHHQELLNASKGYVPLRRYY